MGAFAYHPDLAQAFFRFNGHILYGTTLSLRQRQILVFRVAVLRKARYLWLQHQAQKADAGLTDEDVARIAFGPLAPRLEPLEATLLSAADELIADGGLSDSTWDGLACDLDIRQILDVIFTVSCYDAVARMTKSLDLDLETDVP